MNKFPCLNSDGWRHFFFFERIFKLFPELIFHVLIFFPPHANPLKKITLNSTSNSKIWSQIIKTYWSEGSETDNLTQILLFKQFFFHFTLLYCFPQKLNLFCGIVSGKKSSHWVFYENNSAFPLMIICLTLLWLLSFN